MSEIGFSCSTCPFFTGADDKGGICRRYPPQVMIVPGNLVGQFQPANLFPAVNKDAYCGEHPLAKTMAAVPIDSRLARDVQGEA